MSWGLNTPDVSMATGANSFKDGKSRYLATFLVSVVAATALTSLEEIAV